MRTGFRLVACDPPRIFRILISSTKKKWRPDTLLCLHPPHQAEKKGTGTGRAGRRDE